MPLQLYLEVKKNIWLFFFIYFLFSADLELLGPDLVLKNLGLKVQFLDQVVVLLLFDLG